MEVQAPSRDHTSENFPVASWLLPKESRPHVMAFYRFARAADDIADGTGGTDVEKCTRLDRMLAVLDGAEPADGPEQAAAQLVESLAQTGVTDQYARHVLQAFRRDAENPRCRTWSDLMLYCRYSAAPVGRFLIDTTGEDAAAYPASDALCAALQVLNHLQDCGDDRRRIDRVYIPTDWLAAEGASVEDLESDRASPALRKVLDRCLDGVDVLLAQATPLSGLLGHSRLRYDAAVIHAIACRLRNRLRRGDPLAHRIALTKSERAVCLARGLLRGLRQR
ncbi:MAG: squalene synthase HpnC [Pseudomonadota bacterium]